MTSYKNATTICAHCSIENSTTVRASTNSFGSMDLDMRPAPMERHTLDTAIQLCRSCGFCAPDLEQMIGTGEVLDSTTYRSILTAEAVPELARRFRAFAHLAEGSGRLAEAGFACLHAAWVCDDSRGVQEAARESRRAVLRLMQIIHAKGQTMTDDLDLDSVLALDLLRRSGQFDEVSDRVGTLSQRKLPEILGQICVCEARLAGARDAACHKVVEATG
jgi:hypothetical protein